MAKQKELHYDDTDTEDTVLNALRNDELVLIICKDREGKRTSRMIEPLKSRQIAILESEESRASTICDNRKGRFPLKESLTPCLWTPNFLSSPVIAYSPFTDSTEKTESRKTSDRLKS